MRSVAVLLIAWLLALSAVQCAKAPDLRPESARFVGKWQDEGSPKNDGYIFNADGTGRDAGTDPTNPGSPINWRVKEIGVLEIQGFGEEGESGGFEPYEYKFEGGDLDIIKVGKDHEWVRYKKY